VPELAVGFAEKTRMNLMGIGVNRMIGRHFPYDPRSATIRVLTTGTMSSKES
jgi:hypothetical protein